MDCVQSRFLCATWTCDDRDFNDPLSQLVTFPFFFSIDENKTKLQNNP